MLFLSEQEMWQSVTLKDVMDAIEDAYAIHKSGNYKMPDRFIAQRDKNMMLYMPCFLDSVIGTKMLSEFPDNPSLGIPYLNGLMILNNAKTGLPKAIMNGSVLTAMRTGAVGGVALRYLAPEDAASVGLVGCGIQGLHQLLYACEVRPITDIYLYDAYAKDLSGFIERLLARLASFGKNAIQIHTCADTRELAEHSRVLISATQAVDPVYPDDEELLRTFAHVCGDDLSDRLSFVADRSEQCTKIVNAAEEDSSDQDPQSYRQPAEHSCADRSGNRACACDR
mgnify:CR=1 FL=1